MHRILIQGVSAFLGAVIGVDEISDVVSWGVCDVEPADNGVDFAYRCHLMLPQTSSFAATNPISVDQRGVSVVRGLHLIGVHLPGVADVFTSQVKP